MARRVADVSAPGGRIVVWANVSTTTPVFNAGFNISSITRNAAGDITYTFAAPLIDANYAVVFGHTNSGTESRLFATPTNASVRVSTFDAAFAAIDVGPQTILVVR